MGASTFLGRPGIGRGIKMHGGGRETGAAAGGVLVSKSQARANLHHHG
jgi:hypothetical protein